MNKLLYLKYRILALWNSKRIVFMFVFRICALMVLCYRITESWKFNFNHYFSLASSTWNQFITLITSKKLFKWFHWSGLTSDPILNNGPNTPDFQRMDFHWCCKKMGQSAFEKATVRDSCILAIVYVSKTIFLFKNLLSQRRLLGTNKKMTSNWYIIY